MRKQRSWAATFVFASAALGQPCGPGWLPVSPSSILGGDTFAMTTFDDGSGPALYAAGLFRTAGGQFIDGVARWDGARWTKLGDGILFGLPQGFSAPPIRTLAVFDDGSGPALYIGGTTYYINGVLNQGMAKWDGSTWTALGGGGTIFTLKAFDDGTGPALYAGGSFFTGAPGTTNIARWKNGQWSALGTGVSGGPVQALAVFDDGTGPALHLGGAFTTANGQPLPYLAKWTGSQYISVGGGVSTPGFGTSTQVASMDVSSVGGSPGLFVAGIFTMAGAVAADKLARWDGTSWSAPPTRSGGSIRCVQAFEEATGPAVYVGGYFGPGNLPAASASRWNGQSWSNLGTPAALAGSSGEVYAFARYTDASGPAIFAAGHFDHMGGAVAPYIARWANSTWTPIGNEPDAAPRVVAQFNGATYIGGEFTSFGRVPATRGIARRVGTEWQSVGGGMDGSVYSLTVWDDGTGPALYAGGLFNIAGQTPARNIARWNGSTWSPLAGGIPGTGPTGNSWTGRVNAIAAYNDGSGSALYAAGSFLRSLGAGDDCIAKWNGSQWLPVGGGLQGTNGANALAVYNNGTGSKLWVGTDYNNAPVPVSLAAWDGTQWSRPIGTPASTILTLTVFTGSGPTALYFGGLSYGGLAIGRIEGTSIQAPMGNPFATGATPGIRTLAVADDGSGPKLFAGGRFDSIGVGSSKNIARWDGQAWSPLTGGAGDTVYAAGQSAPNKVMIGGDFSAIAFTSAGRLAEWQGCGCYANCDASITAPVLNALDFQCFLQRFAANDPYANCDQSTISPALNINDFQCFLNKFAAGCT